MKTAIVAGLIIAGLGAGAYSTFAAEEGGRQGHRKHPPMHGEIVAIDDSSVTISLVFGDRPVREENEGERVKENKFEEGDELTFVITEDTKIHNKDGDFEAGDMVFVSVMREDDISYARVIAERLQPRNHLVGAVLSVDTDANEILIEKRDGTQETLSYEDDTEFYEMKEEASEYDVEVGDHVAMRGHHAPEGEETGTMRINIMEAIDWSQEVMPGGVE
jgi:hypothetical protein